MSSNGPEPWRAHQGRNGSGVSARASSTLASTDFVVGRNIAAATVLVTRSIIPVSPARPGTPVVQQHQDVQGRLDEPGLRWIRRRSLRPGQIQ
jgi:hypothetical protein